MTRTAPRVPWLNENSRDTDCMYICEYAEAFKGSNPDNCAVQCFYTYIQLPSTGMEEIASLPLISDAPMAPVHSISGF